MDSFISTALEEICAEGPGGIPLQKLWWSLQSSVVSFGLLMDDAVKEAIWGRLLALPDLLFKSPSAIFGPRDSAIRSPDQSEKLGLRVVADEHLRDSFLGIYDLKAANVEITPVLKQVLERLAVARSIFCFVPLVTRKLGMWSTFNASAHFTSHQSLHVCAGATE